MAMPTSLQILIAYAQLLRQGDLPEEALATAPVPPATAEELLKGGLQPINAEIAAWAEQHADLGVEERFIDLAASLPAPETRFPGGLGHAGSEDGSEKLEDTGGDNHFRNAVENSLESIHRSLGSSDDTSSPAAAPQTDDN